MSLIVVTPSLKSTLTADTVAGPTAGLYAGAKVMLWTNDFSPTKETVLANLTAAIFDGYALSTAITWGTVAELANGGAQVFGDLKQFLCTGDTTEEVVYGYGFVNSAGTTLLAVERLADPIPITGAGDLVAIVPRLTRDTVVA